MQYAPHGVGAPATARPDRTQATTRLAIGFAGTTRILTLDGMIPVDCLAPGDRIVTRDCGMVRLVAIVSNVNSSIRPVILSAGAVGQSRPEVDMTLGAGQPLLLRDWRAPALYGQASAMVPAHRLIDGTFIRLGPEQRRLRLFTLIFAAPHVIYAEGVECAAGA